MAVDSIRIVKAKLKNGHYGNRGGGLTYGEHLLVSSVRVTSCRCLFPASDRPPETQLAAAVGRDSRPGDVRLFTVSPKGVVTAVNLPPDVAQLGTALHSL